MQLELPGAGYGPARYPTRRRIELFADWIEAQALVLEEPLSQPNLVDRLEGTALVRDSDDAWALIGDAFSTCRFRRRHMDNAYPFSIAGDVIEFESRERKAYLFCLLASLPEQFVPLRLGYPKDFRDHFEEVVAAALRVIMQGWDVYETGWSKIAAEGKLGIVQRIAEWAKGKFQDQTVFPSANDAQVDVAVVKRFRDGRSAIPVLLGQCATGVTDWTTKAARPNIDRWCKAVQFSSTPVRLFAVPFALDDESFREASVESNGLILDRIRICGALASVDVALDAKLTAWLDQARPMIPLAA
ncbi:MAG: hypothetical protein J0H11_10115 [Rhizobiales bacterium]|nr:hypothetical protein [Hyphomicrobiales bacterium]